MAAQPPSDFQGSLPDAVGDGEYIYSLPGFMVTCQRTSLASGINSKVVDNQTVPCQ